MAARNTVGVIERPIPAASSFSATLSIVTRGFTRSASRASLAVAGASTRSLKRIRSGLTAWKRRCPYVDARRSAWWRSRAGWVMTSPGEIDGAGEEEGGKCEQHV